MHSWRWQCIWFGQMLSGRFGYTNKHVHTQNNTNSQRGKLPGKLGGNSGPSPLNPKPMKERKREQRAEPAVHDETSQWNLISLRSRDANKHYWILFLPWHDRNLIWDPQGSFSLSLCVCPLHWNTVPLSVLGVCTGSKRRKENDWNS